MRNLSDTVESYISLKEFRKLIFYPSLGLSLFMILSILIFEFSKYPSGQEFVNYYFPDFPILKSDEQVNEVLLKFYSFLLYSFLIFIYTFLTRSLESESDYKIEEKVEIIKLSEKLNENISKLHQKSINGELTSEEYEKIKFKLPKTTRYIIRCIGWFLLITFSFLIIVSLIGFIISFDFFYLFIIIPLSFLFTYVSLTIYRVDKLKKLTFEVFKSDKLIEYKELTKNETITNGSYPKKIVIKGFSSDKK